MGIYCSLYSASTEQLAAIARHPPFVNLLWGEAGWSSQRSFFSRLRHRAPSCLNDVSGSMQISLDKAWHGLHFLFSGSSAPGSLPASFLLAGGSDIGFDSRIVLPGEALQFGAFVASLGLDLLRARFDPAAMERLDVYPSVIWKRDGQEGLEWLLEFHDRLPGFFRDIAEEKHGYVITIA